MTEIWGHRGASSHAPENTLKAFEIAADMGIYGVELDVQLTKDGEVVVIHDETLERVSDGGGFVRDHTLSELKRLNFNKKKITPPFFMEIPTLAEVFSLLQNTRLVVNIELKTGIIFYKDIEEKTLALARDYGMYERVVYSSFNHYSVMRVKELDPSAKTAFLCGGGILCTAAACQAMGVDGLHIDLKGMSYPGLADDCHERGVALRVWTTNDKEDIKAAFAMGVDAVITDFPDRALRIKKGLEHGGGV